ncbi:MAG: SAP domain-containing protein [Planctomycetota bacterium]
MPDRKPQNISVAAVSVAIDGKEYPQGKVLGHFDDDGSIVSLEPGVTPGHIKARLRAKTLAVVEPSATHTTRYDGLKAAELKEEAKTRGLDFAANAGKQALIKLLVDHDADSTAPDADD